MAGSRWITEKQGGAGSSHPVLGGGVRHTHTHSHTHRGIHTKNRYSHTQTHRYVHIHRDSRPDHTYTEGRADGTHRCTQTCHTCIHTHTHPLSPALPVGTADPCPSLQTSLQSLSVRLCTARAAQDTGTSPRACTLPLASSQDWQTDKGQAANDD